MKARGISSRRTDSRRYRDPGKISQQTGGISSESINTTATKLVVIDLETGGLETHRPIIQIGAIAVDEDFNELEVFEVKISFDEAEACPDALRRIHYRRAEWKRSAIAPKKAAWALARFLRRHATVEVVRRDLSVFRVAQLASHHSQFDGPFLMEWFDRLDIFLPASYRVFCTLQRAYWHFHENPHLPQPDDFRLGTLCDYFNVPLNPNDAHEAITDVRATIGLLRAMTHVGTAQVANVVQCPLA